MMSLSAQRCGHDQHPSFLTRDTTFPSKVSILILVYSVFPVSERNWFSHHTALGGERGAGHSTSDVEAGEGGTSHLPSAVEAGERGTGCMASPCIEWLFSGVRVKKVGTYASPF